MKRALVSTNFDFWTLPEEVLHAIVLLATTHDEPAFLVRRKMAIVCRAADSEFLRALTPSYIDSLLSQWLKPTRLDTLTELRKCVKLAEKSSRFPGLNEALIPYIDKCGFKRHQHRLVYPGGGSLETTCDTRHWRALNAIVESWDTVSRSTKRRMVLSAIPSGVAFRTVPRIVKAVRTSPMGSVFGYVRRRDIPKEAGKEPVYYNVAYRNKKTKIDLRRLVHFQEKKMAKRYYSIVDYSTAINQKEYNGLMRRISDAQVYQQKFHDTIDQALAEIKQ